MAGEKLYKVKPEAHMDDDAQSTPLSEIIWENQPSQVTLPKKKIIDERDLLFCGTDDLKSVQEYTDRIKSFLGWESNEKETDLLKDQKSDSDKAIGKTGEDVKSCDKDGNNDILPDVICSSESEKTLEKNIEVVDESERIELKKDDDTAEVSSIHLKDSSLTSCENNLNTTKLDIINEKINSDVLECTSNGNNLKMESLDRNDKNHSDFEFSDQNCNQIKTTDTISNKSLNVYQDSLADMNIKVKTQDNVQCQQILDINPEEIQNTHMNHADENDNNEIEGSHNGEGLNYTSDQMLINKNITKPYMENIRRLSLDIVKDVINSARSSIHELYSNKSEQINDKSNGESDEGHDYNNLSSAKYGSSESKIDYPGKEEYPFVKTDAWNTVDEDTICGFGCFKPQWIQKWATAKVYLLIFSMIGVIQGSYYKYFVAMLSTLEKRYAFRSKVSGTLLMADEIVPLVFGVFVGYIGGKTHRPRMVALGMFFSATCCFITALPYFIYGSTKHLSLQNVKNETNMEFCDTEFKKIACDMDDRPPTLSVVGLFVFASFLKGFATLSYYVIGIPYLDDNSKKINSPLYLAIALALRLLGPLVGFLMSSGFLKFYENPFEDPGFGPDDPRWIGAWWMGFCVQGVLLVIFTIPIALFPRRLPGHKKPDQQHSSPDNKSKWKDMFGGLLDALKRLWKNPMFVFLAINTVMKIFGHFGHAIMLPKYMENQFRLSASDASLFSGATSIACIMVSTILGGFLIWKYRPNAKLLLTGLIASEVTLCLGYLVLMIPHCEPAEMFHFGNNNNGLILNSVCNQNCGCSYSSFTPFCDPDGKTTYFSPCFAGCTLELDSVMTDKVHKEFGNCSCVFDPDGGIGGKITEGFCVDENCWTQTIAYICILLILVTISNTLTVAHTMILLRSVHNSDKSLALGTFETFICLFGFVPFPVVYGALVDSACLIWESSCDQTGNCWFYDMKKYNYLLHGASSFFCCVSICCLTTLYCFSSRLKNMYEDDENDEEPANIKLDTVSGSITKL